MLYDWSLKLYIKFSLLMQWIFSPLHSTYFNEVQWKKGYLNSIVSIKMNFIWRNWWKFNDWKYVCCSCSGWIKKGDEKKNWPIDTVSLISIKLSHLWPSFNFSIHQKFIYNRFFYYSTWIDKFAGAGVQNTKTNRFVFFFQMQNIFCLKQWICYEYDIVFFRIYFKQSQNKTRGKTTICVFFSFFKKWLEWEFWKKVLLRKAISYK